MSLITEALNKLDDRMRPGDVDAHGGDDAEPIPIARRQTARKKRKKALYLIPAALLIIAIGGFLSLKFFVKHRPDRTVVARQVESNNGRNAPETGVPAVSQPPAQDEPADPAASEPQDASQEPSAPPVEEAAAAATPPTAEPTPSSSVENPGSETPVAINEGTVATEEPIAEEQTPSEPPAEAAIEEAEEHDAETASSLVTVSATESMRQKFAEAFDRAVAYHRAKDYFNALSCYKQCLSINPDASDVYANMGIICTIMEDYDAAISHLKKALSIDPKNPTAHNNLGVIYLQRNDNKHAFAEFESALTQNPDNPESCVNLGLACMGLGRPSGAAQAFEAALRLAPAQPDAHYNYALLLDRQGDYEEAIHHYSQFVQWAEKNEPRSVQQVRNRILYLQKKRLSHESH